MRLAPRPPARIPTSTARSVRSISSSALHRWLAVRQGRPESLKQGRLKKQGRQTRLVMNGRLDARNQGDMATDSSAAFNRMRCEACSGRLHVVDQVGPTLECEDCGSTGIWDNEKRVISYSPPTA